MFDNIIYDLINKAQTDESLIQLGSTVSASQYLKLYCLSEKYLTKGSIVLDWGTGNGHFSYFLVKMGYDTYGYGFNGYPKICDQFDQPVYKYKNGDWQDPVSIPYEANFFDGVVSVGVLEHVRESGGNEIKSLKEICRILKDNGIFICYHLPNKYSWIEMIASHLKKDTHQYKYDKSEIIDLLKTAGFEIIEIKRYGFLPRNLWRKGYFKKISRLFFLADLYNMLDDMLSLFGSYFCQNFYFIARKK